MNPDKTLRELANKSIAEKLSQIEDILKECYNLADVHGLSFKSPIEQYGMGGYYIGKSSLDWEESDRERENHEGQWRASSQGC